MRRLTPAIALAVAASLAGCSSGSSEPEFRPEVPRSGTTASSVPASATAAINVSMNHCFVEPISFDGQLWNVPFDDQFGWGGLEPKNWRGSGVITRISEHRARYDDDGGATVLFLPVDHPSVVFPSGGKALCD